MTTERLPTFEDIRAASRRLRGQVLDTPCLHSRTLSKLLGCELYLKFENLQFVSSFKERGALNKLLTLSPRERAAGVIAVSAGNHAQGVAFHAGRLGIRATIVMPVGTPHTKIARTREHGATVVVEGESFDSAQEIAREQAKRFGLTPIHPFDDAEVIAGQGTMGLEILASVPQLDGIVVPIGGGGLISGVGIAADAINPGVEIIGVESQNYGSMYRALRGDPDIVGSPATIAEGIAVKSAGSLTRQIVRRHVKEILLVEEDRIEQAIGLLHGIEKTVVEGAGATGLAAILRHPKRFEGKRIAVPLTGGNIDARTLINVLSRELQASGGEAVER